MAKKNEETKVIVEEEKVEGKPKIAKLDVEFGREDLNKLRDKVNEIIDNAKVY